PGDGDHEDGDDGCEDGDDGSEDDGLLGDSAPAADGDVGSDDRTPARTEPDPSPTTSTSAPAGSVPRSSTGSVPRSSTGSVARPVPAPPPPPLRLRAPSATGSTTWSTAPPTSGTASRTKADVDDVTSPVDVAAVAGCPRSRPRR
ncbi:hypothetical protein NGM37_39205, partial [Streptomyces sp. TRM76130]|nr:hypothetical protein [Streptomyces sp. TRM76130]